jgi:hypothetical protein
LLQIWRPHEQPVGSTMPPIHPVIIVGAGPCGLVAALTLKKADVPFVIYERASASKVCSNAGSGFDMAPTALKILEDWVYLVVLIRRCKSMSICKFLIWMVNMLRLFVSKR